MPSYIKKLYHEKKRSWEMFDRIAGRYDLLNRLLSLGIDSIWRRKVVQFLPPRNYLKILDLATGTADLLITLSKNSRVKKAIGVDLSTKMLSIAYKKINFKKLNHKICLIRNNMENLSLTSNSFDFASIAFGIRNSAYPLECLKQFHRVLKPNGCLAVLELSIPKNKIIQYIYLIYFRYFLTFIGGWISGDKKAYKYLNNTVEDFLQGDNFCKLMGEANFSDIKYTHLTFGIATIYMGVKR